MPAVYKWTLLSRHRFCQTSVDCASCLRIKHLTLCATIGVAQALNPRPAGAVHSPRVPQSLAAAGVLSSTGCCGQVLPGRRRRVSNSAPTAPGTSLALTTDTARQVSDSPALD